MGKDLRRKMETLTKEDLKIQKSVYNVRVRKLFGIFTTLFFFNFISVTPFFISIIVHLATGNVPPEVLTAVLILYLVSNVSNPLIQSYFRKDLKDSIIKYTKKIFCYNFKEESGTARSSHHASNSNSFSQSRSRNAPGGVAVRGNSDDVIGRDRGSCDDVIGRDSSDDVIGRDRGSSDDVIGRDRGSGDDVIGRDRGSSDDAIAPGKDRENNGDIISPPGSIK